MIVRHIDFCTNYNVDKVASSSIKYQVSSISSRYVILTLEKKPSEHIVLSAKEPIDIEYSMCFEWFSAGRRLLYILVSNVTTRCRYNET